MDNINDPQQSAVPNDAHEGGVPEPPSHIPFTQLNIDPTTAPPPIGEPGPSLAAWAAPDHVLGIEHASNVTPEEQQQIQATLTSTAAMPAAAVLPTIWQNFYLYDMYRCRDEAEEEEEQEEEEGQTHQTQGSFMTTQHLMACRGTPLGSPLPPPTQTEARRRLGDVNKLLYLIARIKDQAAEERVTFAEAAPRPLWIDMNIANAKMLMQRFGGSNATTHLNRLVAGLAKKALKKLQKMKRVGGPQQQQAEGGGTGEVGGSSSAGGSEGGGGGDGGGT